MAPMRVLIIRVPQQIQWFVPFSQRTVVLLDPVAIYHSARIGGLVERVMLTTQLANKVQVESNSDKSVRATHLAWPALPTM